MVRGKKRRTALLGVLLGIALALGLVPGLARAALVDAWEGNPYAGLVNTTTTVTFNGKPWYIIADGSTAADAGTLTLLAADTSFGLSKFDDSYSNDYDKPSAVKTYLSNIVAGTAGDGKPDFSNVASAIGDEGLYLLSRDEVSALGLSSDVLKMSFTGGDTHYGEWWLRSPGYHDVFAAFVDGVDCYVDYIGIHVFKSFGVRPALQLNLSSVIFESESKSFSLKPHTHSLAYAASGATITATCTAKGCTDPAYSATLQISRPAKATYGDGGTGDVTAYVEYTIAKADPTAAAPAGLAATYGQTLADVSLEGRNPEGNTPGTWAWADATTTSVGGVGKHAFKADFTPTDAANYNGKEGVDVGVTVGRAANPATVAGTASVARGGNVVELSKNVEKNGATGEVRYAIDGEALGCSVDGATGALTSGDATGDVTVKVTVAEDDNHFALEAKTITVTVTNKKAQTVTAADVSATYGDAGKKVSAKTDGDGKLSYEVTSGDAVSVDRSTGALTIHEAGKATVTVTAAETATCERATKEVAVSVARASVAEAKVALRRTSCAYDGKAKEPGVKSVTLNGRKLKADVDFTVSYKSNKNLGTAAVTVTGKGNYEGAAKATFSITLAKARLATVGNTAKSGFSASWAKVAGAKSYELQWRRAGGKWKTVSAKGTSKLVAGLKPGGLYQFRVCAVAGETKGAWSKVSRRYLRSVKGVNATVRKAGTVTASWAADPEADLGYVVKVRYEKGGAVVATASVAAGKTKATVKVPKSGRRLWVEVRPVRASGGKAYSGILHGSWAK